MLEWRKIMDKGKNGEEEEWNVCGRRGVKSSLNRRGKFEFLAVGGLQRSTGSSFFEYGITNVWQKSYRWCVFVSTVRQLFCRMVVQSAPCGSLSAARCWDCHTLLTWTHVQLTGGSQESVGFIWNQGFGAGNWESQLPLHMVSQPFFSRTWEFAPQCTCPYICWNSSHMRS